MQSLEDVYRQIDELKKEKKDLNKMFKDELQQHERHQEIMEAMKTLKEEKKGIENTIRSSSLGDSDRIQDISSEMQALGELLSDIALNMYVNNETVEIEHQDDKYVPVFSVKFKKSA